MRADIASASTTRPELAAFLTHLDMEEPDDPDSDDADDHGTGEPDDSEWEGRGADHDFRTGRAERHTEYLDEARDFARRMMEGNRLAPDCHSRSADPAVLSLGRRADEPDCQERRGKLRGCPCSTSGKDGRTTRIAAWLMNPFGCCSVTTRA